MRQYVYQADAEWDYHLELGYVYLDQRSDLANVNGPVDLIVADVDGDGLDDLVVIGKRPPSSLVVSVLRRTGLSDSQTLKVQDLGPHTVVRMGDVDGDGRADLVVFAEDGTVAEIFYANGDGRVTTSESLPLTWWCRRRSYFKGKLTSSRISTAMVRRNPFWSATFRAKDRMRESWGVSTTVAKWYWPSSGALARSL